MTNNIKVSNWWDGTLAIGLGIWICLFNLYDIIVTREVLAKGGTETNLFMRDIVDSDVKFFLVKVFGLAVFFTICYLADRQQSKFLVPVMCAALAFYAFVAGWNTYVWWRL